MTRFAQPVTALRATGPIDPGTLELPVVDVTHFEWATFQWSLSDPPGGSAAGTVIAADFYVTALPDDRMRDQSTDEFFSPLARPDLWVPAPWIAFPSLPAGAPGSDITQPWRCAAHTYVACIMTVTVELDRFSYTRTAYGS